MQDPTFMKQSKYIIVNNTDNCLPMDYQLVVGYIWQLEVKKLIVFFCKNIHSFIHSIVIIYRFDIVTMFQNSNIKVNIKKSKETPPSPYNDKFYEECIQRSKKYITNIQLMMSETNIKHSNR